MPECNKCGESNLSWSDKSGKWKLYKGSKEHVCGIPTMAFQQKKIIDSKKPSIVGFCFNNRNLEEGLLEAIKRGEYV